MGGRSGALGMRVSGRAGGRERKEGRANSSSAADPPSPIAEMPTRASGKLVSDGFFSSSGRPRSDSAPVPQHLEAPLTGLSVITTGRGMGRHDSAGLLGQTLSTSTTSGGIDEEDEDQLSALNTGYPDDDAVSASAMSGRPSELGITGGDTAGPLSSTLADEGSDVDGDELEEEGFMEDDTQPLPENGGKRSNRSSFYPNDLEELTFDPIPFQPRQSISGPSALTALLNKHVPHLVSTSSEPDESEMTASNPFASLYASVGAISNIPSISLELYFPHSDNPTTALLVKVRKDATVEEVTGYGLFKYWEDARQPTLASQESEARWSTVGWGLRIVEDDGEVDEDFPREYLVCVSFSCIAQMLTAALDRDSQISRFSYGQFAIVEATESQSLCHKSI